jgi:hypothetical protein
MYNEQFTMGNPVSGILRGDNALISKGRGMLIFAN